MYKILAKLLSWRTKGVLLGVIDKRQNEAINKARRINKKCLVFKVDYEKAYDSVSWYFLLYMQHRLGFLEKWIGWIKQCLTSAIVLVLVNGSPTKEFTLERGLRQGDPLAPFLFTIVAKGLSGMMREACAKKLFQRFPIGRNIIEINLLQYADDTIFFGEATYSNLFTIKSMLRSRDLK